MDKLYNEIAKAAKLYNASKVVLFGSRARGDNRERSDIDLAVYNMSESNQILFAEALEQLHTLLDFDLVFVSDRTNKELLNNIEKDGVVLMRKFEEKYNKLTAAVERLEEAVKDYSVNPISSIRDGVIQRFEFCTELAWKATREYLIDQGYTEINSPKAVMKQAYSDRIISDEGVWLKLLNDRNLTSHLYDEETASEIFNSIKGEYICAFKALINSLNS